MNADEKYVPLAEFLSFICIDDKTFWNWVEDGIITKECFFTIGEVTRVLCQRALQRLHVAANVRPSQSIDVHLDNELVKNIISAHRRQKRRLEDYLVSIRSIDNKEIAVKRADKAAIKKFIESRASAMDTLRWAASNSAPDVREAINDGASEIFEAHEHFVRIVRLSDEIVTASERAQRAVEKTIEIQKYTIDLLNGILQGQKRQQKK